MRITSADSADVLLTGHRCGMRIQNRRKHRKKDDAKTARILYFVNTESVEGGSDIAKRKE